jgi:hypothetical protein
MKENRSGISIVIYASLLAVLLEWDHADCNTMSWIFCNAYTEEEKKSFERMIPTAVVD